MSDYYKDGMTRSCRDKLSDAKAEIQELTTENERLRSALEEIAGWESAAVNGRNDLTARLAGIAKRALESES